MTDKPDTRYSARLQVVDLGYDHTGILLDQWDGPPPASAEFAKRVKEAWGVRGVVVTDGTVDVG